MIYLFTVSCLWIEFNLLKMETRLSKATLEKNIANVKYILEKKPLATIQKLQLLAGFSSFTTTLVNAGCAFLHCFYDVLF